jgi:hypothetical protein
MEASRMEVYLGARVRRGIELSTRELSPAFLRDHFSGLTPKLLGRVRPFAEKNVVDMIKIPERPVKVPTIMLGTELSNITLDSPVLIINKGADFNVISKDPKTVGDVVGIMQQIFSSYEPSHSAINGIVKNAREVSAWLGEIKSGDNDAVGMFMYLTRFFDSTLDHIEIAIPLGMTVVDHKRS